MNNRTDIWNRLQEHEIPPDQGRWDRLWGVIRFERLRHHSIPPPEEARVLLEVGFKRKVFLRRMVIATSIAAMLILMAGGVVLLRKSSDDPSPPKLSVAHPVIRDSVAKAPVDTPSTADRSQTAVQVDEQPVIAMDGQVYPLTDNDLLLTLTGFTNPPRAHYRRIPHGLYSGLAISDQAATMINTTQETRSNGKPTRRARRMKKRLEGWKHADEERFDKGGANALDPFDLGTFIFKY